MVGRKENLPMLPTLATFTVKFAVDIPLGSLITSVICNKVLLMYPVFLSSHAPFLFPGPLPAAACWTGTVCGYQPAICGYCGCIP